MTTTAASGATRKIKCVVWDLDHTLWHGVLLEDPDVRLRPEVVEIIHVLDERGILQSIASRNDAAAAWGKLQALSLDEYFLYPQINWDSKAANLERIAQALNIGLDTFAFIDDQAFERDEVQFRHPAVLCLDVGELAGLPARPEFNPRFVTDDARLRRQLYRNDLVRQQAEADYQGAPAEFLATLGMVFSIAPAQSADLQRAEELTVRTHQLNTTGRTYSYEELDAFSRSPEHLLLIASLEDRYGAYGRIGLALVACPAAVWRLQLLLMSCRVMSRGVGAVLLGHVMRLARAAGVRLQADFVHNERNHMMYMTYKFAGFREVQRDGAAGILEADLEQIPPLPAYIRLHATP